MRIQGLRCIDSTWAAVWYISTTRTSGFNFYPRPGFAPSRLLVLLLSHTLAGSDSLLHAHTRSNHQALNVSHNCLTLPYFLMMRTQHAHHDLYFDEFLAILQPNKSVVLNCVRWKAELDWGSKEATPNQTQISMKDFLFVILIDCLIILQIFRHSVAPQGTNRNPRSWTIQEEDEILINSEEGYWGIKHHFGVEIESELTHNNK